MTEVMNAPHPAPGAAAAPPLRTREPRGLIDPAESTTRLARLIGRPLTHVDTSVGRIVLRIAADPVHLVVVCGPLQISGHPGPGLTLEGSPAVALLSGWVGRAVTDLRVDPGGGLHLGLGEHHLVAAAEELHEAWEIRGMDGGLMVCLPGGRISVWAPTFGRIPRAHRADR
jgi:Family of unknown function (DUF6188)